MNKITIPITKILPQWSKRITTELGGRDALGLSRISSMITDYLLPGIITTTDRARYYSFYCWALWHIQNEGGISRFQDFVDEFRRREAMIALSTIANSYRSSTVGAIAVRRELATAKERGEVKSDFRVLPSNPLGGYGQYYQGCLYALRLTYRPEDGIDRITSGLAQELAQFFNENVKKSTYVQKRLFKKTFISYEELEESKSYFSLDALSLSFANNEREKLIDLFFGFHENPPSDASILRRQTLAHILNVILEYQNLNFKINLKRERKDFPTQEGAFKRDWYLVYPPYYYDMLWPEGRKPFSYKEPKYFEVTHSLWKQFCLQEFFTQGMEHILTAILGVLGGRNSGLALNEVIEELLKDGFDSFFKKVINQKCNTPYELLAAIGLDSIPNEQLSMQLQKDLNILHPCSEAQVLKNAEKNPGAVFAKGLFLLAILYGKWRGANIDPGFLCIAQRAGTELWIGKVFPYLDAWFDKQCSWKESLKIFISNLILDQHDRVMFEKRNLESCWLHRIESKIVKDQDYFPAWRLSRHNNAFGILQDLRLIQDDQHGCTSLTAEGKRILKRILE